MTEKHSVLAPYLEDLAGAPSTRLRGRVREVTGLVIHASLPSGAVGDLVTIEGREGAMPAEIVGFTNNHAVLMPLGSVAGVGLDSAVDVGDGRFEITAGPELLGRVLDGLGRPIDGHGPIAGEPWPVQRRAPAPLTRRPIERALPTGVRAIDGLLTIGEGQRIGLFSASGVGKSTLLGQIARGADVDVVVACLVGERGREVRDFVHEVLDADARARSVVVCATSDEPALARLKSGWVATAVAEWFRDRGQRVLLLVDSITRFARAHREVGLAAGEPPTRHGFPPSTFSVLPQLVERAGQAERGSITAIYSVLVEGDDMREPIADEVRGVLDGHIVLGRELAHRNQWPAIDVLASLSRVMPAVVDEEHRRAGWCFREVLEAYESRRDLIELGAYEFGSDRRVDSAIGLVNDLRDFLRQGPREHVDFAETRNHLLELTR